MTENNLNNKNIVIIGGTTGLGLSASRVFTQNDANVIVVGRNEESAEDESIRSFIKTKQPLDGGRIGRPSDLDGLAVYFMSDQSRFTTGQVIALDGGWTVT